MTLKRVTGRRPEAPPVHAVPQDENIARMAEKTDENVLYLPVTTLPSKFLPYPPGVKISYRRYGWMEVKYLSQAAGMVSDDDKLQMAMEGITVQGMDRWDLTAPDFLYIELLRKISTTNPSYFEVAYPCPKCKLTTTFSVRLGDLIFEDLDVPALPATANLSFGEMSFSPITVKGQQALKNVGEIPKIFQSSAFLAMMCTSHPYEEAYQLITERCNARDIQIMEQIDSMFDHGLRSVKNACSNRLPTYHVVDGINYGEILTMHKRRGDGDIEHIKELMKKHKFNPVSASVSEADVKVFLEDIGCVTYEVCNHETTLALDGGEGFVMPFRFTRSDVVDAISFGDSGRTATK